MDFSLDLNLTWYVLLGILLTGYAVLDGFDLGVGILHLFSRKADERRILINAIGPVWDGNEVWLVVSGGVLFAAFPHVYATVFSGFYLAFMMVLFALILRAVSLEFRGKQPMGWWQSVWDTAFSLGSSLAAFLFGVVIGNLAWRIPLDRDHEFAGTFLSLLHPYALGAGVTSLFLFAAHGAGYLMMKTEGDLFRKARQWCLVSLALFTLCYLGITLATVFYAPHMLEPFRRHPVLFTIPLALLAALANIPREISKDRPGRVFLSSSAVIFLLMAIFGTGMFPNLVASHPNPEHSLTLYNAASSPKTLGIMLVITAIGMPLVLVYTALVYRIFRGKVKLDGSSY